MTGVKIWSDCAFSQPIGAGQLEHGRNIYFSLCILVKSFNRSWNHDSIRFHPILTISPDFNPISPIFYFSKRFNTQSMFWLVKSYDFTSQNTILTTLLWVFSGLQRGSSLVQLELSQRWLHYGVVCVNGVALTTYSFSFYFSLSFPSLLSDFHTLHSSN